MAVQITPAQEQRLNHLAAETRRSPDELAQESMDRYLAYEEDLHAVVKRGRDDIAAGRLWEHEQVMAHLDALLEQK